MPIPPDGPNQKPFVTIASVRRHNFGQRIYKGNLTSDMSPAPLTKVLRQFPHGITVSYRVAYLLVESV